MAATVFFANFIANLLSFQFERPVFLRESASKMYSLTPYILTKNVIDVPVTLLQALIVLTIAYWGIGLNLP